MNGKAAHLLSHELPIRPLSAHQMIGGTILNDVAIFEHDDTIEIAYRGQPMRNGNHGAPSH
ncbi:MAG: hypothetical protein J0H98_07780, partial [Solirubrobacterales bacterium]|nr:hypothetical protein [Solirubrobacterales bacterium]